MIRVVQGLTLLVQELRCSCKVQELTPTVRVLVLVQLATSN
jgi:hypothetical protein